MTLVHFDAAMIHWWNFYRATQLC